MLPTSRSVLTAALCAAALVVVGCGQGPFDQVSVSGTVLYEDGEPVMSEQYILKFLPQVESPDGKNFPRAGTAKVRPDGRFDVVTTRKYNDGLIAGKHRVYLKLSPGPDGSLPVPPEYADPKQTPLEIDTANGRRLEIVVPRPAPGGPQ